MDLGAGTRSAVSPASELTALGGGEGAAEFHREGFAPADTGMEGGLLRRLRR
jgi:hypothetical protein